MVWYNHLSNRRARKKGQQPQRGGVLRKTCNILFVLVYFRDT